MISFTENEIKVCKAFVSAPAADFLDGHVGHGKLGDGILHSYPSSG